MLLGVRASDRGPRGIRALANLGPLTWSAQFFLVAPRARLANGGVQQLLGEKHTEVLPLILKLIFIEAQQ